MQDCQIKRCIFNFKILEDSRRLAFQRIRKCRSVQKGLAENLNKVLKHFTQISVDATRLEQNKVGQIYISRDSGSSLYDGTTAHLIFQENRVCKDKNKDLFFSPLSCCTNGLTVLVERTDTPFIPTVLLLSHTVLGFDLMRGAAAYFENFLRLGEHSVAIGNVEVGRPVCQFFHLVCSRGVCFDSDKVVFGSQ